ncbi:MAG: hypothetical protein WB579_05710, partial [Bryobacteraceae bacterium]
LGESVGGAVYAPLTRGWAVNGQRSELWILDGLGTPRPWYARLMEVRWFLFPLLERTGLD